ncbi:MAG: hydantoinase/oxoprolinase family protein [Pseudomonadota bacterium]
MQGHSAGIEGQVSIGIDTGGTFTDAVVMEEASTAGRRGRMIAKAKRLTTHGDLSLGIGAALSAVLAEAEVGPDRVSLVSLSTTLATNALVEGKGAPAGLVMIGFDAADLSRQGLGAALEDTPLIALSGGHDAMGAERATFDAAALRAALAKLNVAALAVCGHFSVRNPAHECAARTIIQAETDLPITCSHELTGKVGGPRRALTALLNARLIPMIDRLIVATEGLLAARGIAAPLMVVRGDGALISSALARERPVETILSGPAASLVGAAWLSGEETAIVSDIGGTTTDVAVLAEGRPRLDPDGASVGGNRTMVEAVAMQTHGLGGDSQVHLSSEIGQALGIALGPRRVVPVALLAAEHGAAIHEALDRQSARSRPHPLDAGFAVATGQGDSRGLKPREAELLARFDAAPIALQALLNTRPDRTAFARLLARGLLAEAGFTPTDAAHITGAMADWDTAAARKAGQLLSRQLGANGRPLAAGPEALAGAVLAALHRRSAEVIVDAAAAADGIDAAEPSGTLLSRLALDRHRGFLRPSVGLGAPLIALGASAATHYPPIAELLSAQLMIDADADVANAIGAVVGRVEIRREVVVTRPAEGRFRAHLPGGPTDFDGLEDALRAADTALREIVAAAAAAAGAETVSIAADRQIDEVAVEGQNMVIEARLTVTGTGRPRHAADTAMGGGA